MHINCNYSKKGMALLLVIQLTLLLAVIILAMSFGSSSKVLIAKSDCDNLQNDFALDSLVYMTRLKLEDIYIRHQVTPSAVKERMQLGPTKISYLISSESGKLNLKWVLNHKTSDQIAEIMSKLQQQMMLPKVELNEFFLSIGNTNRSTAEPQSFENIFKIGASELRSIYGPAEDNRCWSFYTTFWGTGRIDINQASSLTLKILLDDFDENIREQLLDMHEQGQTQFADYLKDQLQLSSRDWLRLKTRVRFDSEPVYTLRATAYTNKIGKSMFCVLQVTSAGTRILLRKTLPPLEPIFSEV